MRLLGIIMALILMGLQGVSQNVYRWYQDGKVIFQLEPNAEQPKAMNGTVEIHSFPQLSKLQNQYRITAVKQLHPDIDDARLRRTYQIEFTEIHLVDQLVETVSQWPEVSFAEKKEIHETFLTPNDQYFTNSTSNGQWALFQINAEQAWDISTGSASIVVAVTDNAININHPDLQNKMVAGRDVVDNDNDPTGCGSNSGFHGSHVSGIVGAETNNSTGIASIGFDVSIMPVKIGDCNGSLTGGYDGIIWAADNGADVINMSWGGGGQSSYGQQVCDYAWNAGSILVAAAGNDGTSQQFYPAAYNNVVSVASSTTGDSKSSFSQYGTWIDVTAPGSSILSTNDGTGYQVTQGTSMASPLVAGLVGLMKSHAPSAPNTNIVNCLLSTADNIDAANPNYIGQLGSGRVNAEQALICMNQYTYSLDVGIASVNAPIGNICSGTITPEVVLQNYGSNAVTGVTITYDIGGAPQTYNWTGNLAQGASTTITLPTMTPGGGSFTFTASTSSPNGNTDQNSSNDTETSNFTTITNGQEVDLTIITDCYGSEITWDIVDGGGNVVVSGGPYADVTGGATNVETICLASGCYTFNINDTYGDGMYGSQWTCTVDGDYFMEDNTGAQLFAMTAPNGDFGYGTSHTFCVSSNVSDDAGVSSVTSPTGSYCATSITPEVILNNYGTNTLTSVDILYDIGGAVQTYNWTGSLAPGANATVTLPAMTVNNGGYTFTASTDSPNGVTDGNPGNDQSNSSFSVFTSSVPLPFVEDFETNGFTANSWTITNADNGITWDIVTVAGTTPGDKAAKMDFYNYGNGSERDGMQTPPLDMSNYTGVSMTYEHAFRRYNTNSADSMIIYASIDCGNTWDRIVAYAEDGTGSFATATTSTVEFDPAGSSEWCMGTVGASCFTVDLSAYDGQSSVIVKFESFNNGIAGNNLFIDNINIDGTANNVPPVADFTANTTSTCEGETVSFTDNSTNNPTSWSWDFGDGNTSTQQNPSNTYVSPGIYTVTLTATNSNGSDTHTQTVTVNANPTPTVSASNTTLCESAVAEPLTGSPSGGTFSGFGVSGSSFDPGVAGAGTHTVTYSYTDGNGCSGTGSLSMVVLPNPTVTMTGPTNTLCVYSPVETLSGSPSGGAFSGPGVTGSDFDPAVAGAGTHTVTYSYTDGNGCVGQDAVTITVSNCTGVEEVENGNVSLYPNPNNGAFMIKGLEPGTFYEVYTATGRLVLRGQVNVNIEPVSLEAVENGNYFIRTIGEDRVGMIRFSVSR